MAVEISLPGKQLTSTAQPEEVAPANGFLASPQMSSFITSEALSAIGGHTDR